MAPKLLIEGYLLKKNRYRNVWRPVWCTLFDDGVLIYKPKRESSLNQNAKKMHCETVFPFVDIADPGPQSGGKPANANPSMQFLHTPDNINEPELLVKARTTSSESSRFDILTKERRLLLDAGTAARKARWNAGLAELQKNNVKFDFDEQEDPQDDTKNSDFSASFLFSPEPQEATLPVDDDNDYVDSEDDENFKDDTLRESLPATSGFNSMYAPTAASSVVSGPVRTAIVYTILAVVFALFNFRLQADYFLKFSLLNWNSSLAVTLFTTEVIALVTLQVLLYRLLILILRASGFLNYSASDELVSHEQAIACQNTGNLNLDLASLLKTEDEVKVSKRAPTNDVQFNSMSDKSSDEEDIRKLIPLLMDTREELLRLSESDDFEFAREVDGVKIYTRSQTAPLLPIFKGVGIVRAKPAEVCDFLFDPCRKAQYDKMFDPNSRILLEVSKDIRVAHHMYKSVPFVTPRDFCLFTSRMQLDEKEGWVIAARSIESKLCPVISTHVRANTLVGGFVIRPLHKADGQLWSNVIFVASTDIKGNIPRPLKLLVGERQPLLINKVDNMMHSLKGARREFG